MSSICTFAMAAVLLNFQIYLVQDQRTFSGIMEGQSSVVALIVGAHSCAPLHPAIPKRLSEGALGCNSGSAFLFTPLVPFRAREMFCLATHASQETRGTRACSCNLRQRML